MPSPIQELSSPVQVKNLVEPSSRTPLQLCENSADEVPHGYYAEFSLSPCVLIVIRTQGATPALCGHFPDTIVAPKAFEDFLRQADLIFSNQRGVRVDCFGVSDVPAQELGESWNSSEIRATILRRLRESGFTSVFEHWPRKGCVQDVIVDGNTKKIHYAEYPPLRALKARLPTSQV
jgi:hypothetical protein